MHQPIKEGLEAYLAGTTGLPESFNQHLESCRDCAGQVHEMRAQARLLEALRTDAEPRPGFYSRVLERIEQSVRPSMWSVMLEPAFGRSIAVAGAVLTLVLGTYLISTEPGDQNSRPASVMATQDLAPTVNLAATPQDRDAVLVNLASFRSN
jgi:anti-sigma factor RsiW